MNNKDSLKSQANSYGQQGVSYAEQEAVDASGTGALKKEEQALLAEQEAFTKYNPKSMPWGKQILINTMSTQLGSVIVIV